MTRNQPCCTTKLTLEVTELVERIYFGVKKRNPNVIVSADVFANARDAYENRFQDWPSWLRRGFLTSPR